MYKRFLTFTLDTENETVCRGDERIQLPPKAYGVLSYLIQNAGRIVTKSELLDAVWPDTFVQDGVLKSCVLEIRRALGDTQKEPKYIATVHRRGYRFLEKPNIGETRSDPVESPMRLVGRATDLKLLRSEWERATAGKRRTIFVSGEAGSGKSSLIDHFVDDLKRTSDILILRGNCREHFGAIEPYYPVFEAITDAVKKESILALTECLRRFAPTWLLQIPGVQHTGDTALLKEESLGANRDRMVREICDALEELTKSTPLVFVIEDLHWSDVSTLDVILALASRGSAARLLLLASYRPVDVLAGSHPLQSAKERLRTQGRCAEYELTPWSIEDVSEFVRFRFGNSRLAERISEFVQSRTEGNPLFVTNLLDYAVSRSWIHHRDGAWSLAGELSELASWAPESLFKMIETQVSRLTAKEQSILEAASVAGLRFPLNLIASDESELLDFEECCHQMARRKLFIHCVGLVAEAGGLPPCGEYQFTHALYQNFFYHRLPPVRRMRLHRGIAEHLERSLKGQPFEAVSELATHYEQCRDHTKAIFYLRLVAKRCASRHVLNDALAALTKAVGLAENLPETERLELQLELIEQLGLVFRLMGQLEASAAEFRRMAEKSKKAGNTAGQLRAQLQLASVASWMNRDLCLQAAETALALCEGPDVSAELRVNVMGQAAYWRLLFVGWDEAGLAASAAALKSARQSDDENSLALHCNRHSFFQTLSSDYRGACKTAQEGVRIAVEMESLMDYSIGHYFEAFALLHLGEWGRMRRHLKSATDLVRHTGHDLWVLLFGLLETFLDIQAFSFDSARSKACEYLERAHALQHPLSIQVSLVLLGLAELGAGQLRSARSAFEKLRAWQARDRILMDWIWKVHLQVGLIDLCLAEGDLRSAERESNECLSLVSRGQERTWIALARYARARLALAQDDLRLARAEIACGLSAIRRWEAPLASWRLHGLAASFAGRSLHLKRAQSIVYKLADSLEADEPLRSTFLSSPQVLAVTLGKAVLCASAG